MDPTTRPRSATMSNRSAIGLAFLTSAAVLILEILAGRLLAPFIGVSLETFTAIIGTVLAGIAAGSAVGGRLADQQNPARLLGPFIVGGGALTIVSPLLVSALGPAANAGNPLSIVFVVAATFFAPAALLSTVSPLVAKLRLDSLTETGAVVGSLSAAGTAGALVGTFVTGFILVAALPTRPLVLGVGVLVVVLGTVVWIRWRGATNDLAMAGVGVLALGGLNLAVESPCDVETAYACVSVEPDENRASGRSLILDGLRHSYVDLDDPEYLDFRYMRLFADVIDAMDPPGGLSALHVGGAGFTMPRWLEATRPGSDSLVLEIDDRLVEVAKDELGLELNDRLRLELGDARLTAEDLDEDSFDLVIADAFSGQTMPWHLTTVEFMAELDDALTPDGILVTNIIDGGSSRFGRAEIATQRRLFEHVAAIVPPGSMANGLPPVIDVPRNIIIIASHRPLPEVTVDPADGTVLSEADTEAFVDGAAHLRDDFAPVDQLRD